MYHVSQPANYCTSSNLLTCLVLLNRTQLLVVELVLSIFGLCFSNYVFKGKGKKTHKELICFGGVELVLICEIRSGEAKYLDIKYENPGKMIISYA